MHETPNSCSGANCADDFVNFRNQIAPQTFDYGGFTYTLVILGFTSPQNGNTCDATLSNVGNPLNQFRTVEGQVTYGCLYASVEQVRDVEIKKVVVSASGTAPAQNFGFTGTSTLAGAPFNGTWSLADGASITRKYNTAEQVVISEATQAAPWAWTSVQCVDGLGASISSIQYSGSQITIPRGTGALTAAASKITCTYTNTYTPRATLTLEKTVDSTGDLTPAVAGNWTLTATGQGAVSGQTVSGAGGSPAVTSQSVIAGTYNLSEESNEIAATTGYVQVPPWVCTTADGASVPVADGSVTHWVQPVVATPGC